MKNRWIISVLLGVLSVLLIPAALAQAELEETYVSPDESFQFSYPGGWALDDTNQGFVVVSGTLDQGSFAVLFFDPAIVSALVDGNTDLESAAAAIIAANATIFTAEGQLITMGTMDVVIAPIQSGDFLGIGFVSELDEGYGLMMVLGDSVEAVAEIEPTLTAMLESYGAPGEGDTDDDGFGGLLGDDDDGDDAPEPSAEASEEVLEQCEEATPADDPDTRSYDEAEEVLEEDTDYQAIFCTDAGAILFDLYEEQTPITVNNFVFLAENGYYNNTIFHRVIEDFMAQGGDPTGTGRGGPGYQFQDEFLLSLTFDRPGLLAMANAGPATNGSQFFITFVPTPHLDGRHTIFGEVLEGMDTLDDILRRDPNNASAPATALETVIILTDDAQTDEK